MEVRTVVYEFADGSRRKYRLGEWTVGLRDNNGRRPIKAIMNFSEAEELTKKEMEHLYNNVKPSLDPMKGEVIYEG